MIHVLPGKFTMNAFDISHYEPDINWSAVVAQEKAALVMIKASEGQSIVDRRFAVHWENASKFGLRRVAYHFYHPAQDPLKQAANFLGTIGQLSEMDGLMIDWESTDNEASKIDAAHGMAFLQALIKMSGKIPFMYGGPYFLKDLNLPADAAKCPLVIAEYGVSGPLVPPPWKSWAFWQYTDKKEIAGVGRCDADLFNGTKADLDQLLLSLNVPKV